MWPCYLLLTVLILIPYNKFLLPHYLYYLVDFDGGKPGRVSRVETLTFNILALFTETVNFL